MDLDALQNYEDEITLANTNKTSFINSISVNDFVGLGSGYEKYCIKVSSVTPSNGDVSIGGICMHYNLLNDECTYNASTVIPNIITRGTMFGDDDYEIYDSSVFAFNDMLENIRRQILGL